MVLDTLIAPAGASALEDAVSAAVVGMIDRVAPGVVQVQSDRHGGGAGIIWRADGAILTNHHVVARDGRAIQVVLPDGRKFAARVTSRNPSLDLAMLQVDAQDLPAVPVGDSSKLRVGELVFAIGHPWGHRGVVTAGIVSGVGTVKIRDSERTAQFIRSDVRLAPGNSGGPLLNAAGAVIGINAMIFGGDLAVAIPSHVATEWLAGQPTHRVYLGVGVQPVQLPPMRPWGPSGGRAAALLVANVDPQGPAGGAGVQPGDILLEANDQPVVDPDSLLNILASTESGSTVRLRVLRGEAVRVIPVAVGAPEPRG